MDTPRAARRSCGLFWFQTRNHDAGGSGAQGVGTRGGSLAAPVRNVQALNSVVPRRGVDINTRILSPVSRKRSCPTTDSHYERCDFVVLLRQQPSQPCQPGWRPREVVLLHASEVGAGRETGDRLLDHVSFGPQSAELRFLPPLPPSRIVRDQSRSNGTLGAEANLHLYLYKRSAPSSFTTYDISDRGAPSSFTTYDTHVQQLEDSPALRLNLDLTLPPTPSNCGKDSLPGTVAVAHDGPGHVSCSLRQNLSNGPIET
jgi:hypothetical protein